MILISYNLISIFDIRFTGDYEFPVICNMSKTIVLNTSAFRLEEKKILDNIMGQDVYDSRIRPAGINGTGQSIS